MYYLVEKPCCQFFLQFFYTFSEDFRIVPQKGVSRVRRDFSAFISFNIPVKSANISFLSLLSLHKFHVQTYVMLCYMVIYIAPLTGGALYSEVLCIYKM